MGVCGGGVCVCVVVVLLVVCVCQTKYQIHNDVELGLSYGVQ